MSIYFNLSSFIYEPFVTYCNYILDDNNVIGEIVNRKYEITPLSNCIDKKINNVTWLEIFNLDYDLPTEFMRLYLMRLATLSCFLNVLIMMNDNLIKTDMIKDTKLNLIDFSSNCYWSRLYIDKQGFIRYDFK